MIGLIGIKEGMSRVFTEDVNSVPVTVVKIDSNVVTQIKKIDQRIKNNLTRQYFKIF